MLEVIFFQAPGDIFVPNTDLPVNTVILYLLPIVVAILILRFFYVYLLTSNPNLSVSNQLLSHISHLYTKFIRFLHAAI